MKGLQRWGLIGIFTSTALFELSEYWANSWHGKWAFLIGLLALVWALFMSQKTTFWFLPAFAWTAFSGVVIFAWRFSRFYTEAPVKLLIAITESSAYTWATFLLLVTLIAVGPKWLRSRIPEALAAFGALSVVKTILQFVLIPYNRGAYSGNASINGCLIASLFPFCWPYLRSWEAKLAGVAAMLCAIGMTGRLAPWLALYGVGFGFIYLKKKSYALVSLGVVLGTLGWVGTHSDIDSGRWPTWKLALRDAVRTHEIWGGAGLGLTVNLVPSIQYKENPKTTQFFLFMHSEPVQVLFELGIIGLLCWLIAVSWVWRKSQIVPMAFPSLCGWLLTSAVNYPLHLPLHALSISCLACLVIQWQKWGPPPGIMIFRPFGAGRAPDSHA